MPSPVLTPRRRSRIAQAAQYSSQRSVALKFNVSQSTVSYCVAQAASVAAIPVEIQQETPPSPSPAPRGSPRRVLDLHTLQHIKNHLETNRWDSNRLVLEGLSAKGIHISLSTLRRARKMLGFGRFKAVTKPYLNEKRKEARLNYAHKQHQREWRKVLFTDETALYIDQLFQAYVTRPIGSYRLDEEFIQYRFRSGIPSMQVWGAIWLGGRSDLVLFDCSESTGKRGGVTSTIYREQITEEALLGCWHKVLRNWRGYGRPWVVEDNAPIHKAKATRERAHELGMRFLDHPACSPCLNPIEPVWNLLKRKLAALRPRPTTQEGLFREAERIWKEIPQAKIDSLILSMPKRIQDVIDAKGGYIDY